MTDAATTKPETPERSLWYYLGVGLSAALLIIVLALATVIIVIPKVSGSLPLTVLTSSMEPGLPPGTLIIVRPIDPSEIVIGNVVTYQIRSGEPDVITHRVTEINTSTDGSRSFTLKGDNNSDPDPDPVLPLQIKGDVWYSIPYVGWVNSGINGSNRTWIVPIVATALFAYAGFTVLSAIVSRRRRITASQPAGPEQHIGG